MVTVTERNRQTSGPIDLTSTLFVALLRSLAGGYPTGGECIFVDAGVFVAGQPA